MPEGAEELMALNEMVNGAMQGCRSYKKCNCTKYKFEHCSYCAWPQAEHPFVWA
jgi:hypothetical protein